MLSSLAVPSPASQTTMSQPAPQTTMSQPLPQIDERPGTRPGTRPSKSRASSRMMSGRMPYPETDSGAYRAHFRRWWEDVGKNQQHKKEDPLVTIGNRLVEVHDMLTPRNTREVTMNRLQTPLRNKVREFAIMTPGTFKKTRRKDKTVRFDPVYSFYKAIKLVLVVVTISRRRRRYVQTGPVRGPLDSDVRSDDFGHSWFSGEDNKETIDTAHHKTVIGPEYQCHFRMQPQYRGVEQFERIALKIRTIKTFEMFPTKVEDELCRRVSYECYDDGRVLAYQGSVPRRFYYIISGQVRQLRTYKLQSGEVTKAVGNYKPGHSTPRDELEKRTPRTSHLVCKGGVEVLILEIEDFLYLIDPPDAPPVGFLRDQSMFRDFPVDEFLSHPESIRSKYFPPNTVICDDANHTKWLYLVMSGECYYLRNQLIPGEEKTSSRPLFGGGPLGENKHKRRPSHASEMIEMSIARYVAKRRSSISYLPEIRTSVVEETLVRNPHGQSIGLPPISGDDSRSLSSHSRASRRSSFSFNIDMPALARPDPIPESHEGSPRESPMLRDRRASVSYDPIAGRERRMSVIEMPADRRNSVIGGGAPSRERRASMFLTERSRTDASISRGRTRQRSKTHPAGRHGKKGSRRQKKAFLQLGQLQSGDIFGLNEVAGTLRVEPSGVSVVSAGAEVISISKRFFRQHAGVLTLLKLESMLQEFVSEEDARDLLVEEDTWKRYKQSVVKTVATDKAEKCRYKRSTRMNMNPNPIPGTT